MRNSDEPQVRHTTVQVAPHAPAATRALACSFWEAVIRCRLSESEMPGAAGECDARTLVTDTPMKVNTYRQIQLSCYAPSVQSRLCVNQALCDTRLG